MCLRVSLHRDKQTIKMGNSFSLLIPGFLKTIKDDLWEPACTQISSFLGSCYSAHMLTLSRGPSRAPEQTRFCVRVYVYVCLMSKQQHIPAPSLATLLLPCPLAFHPEGGDQP